MKITTTVLFLFLFLFVSAQKSDTVRLKQVVVTGRAPLIEQKLDKTIIHVDASPTNAGLNALDILGRSPGILLDKDGNISLNGKSSPLVLIDGKPTYLGAADLATLLSGIPGSNLDAVEIMTNPPARYDAAGKAGVINIRTKKLRQQGMNGSLTVGGGMGIHPRSTNSLNFNYHEGKVNFFANYSYSYIDRKSEFHLFRNIRNQQTQAILQSFEQTTLFHPTLQTHTVKTGLDFDISKKTTVGFGVTGLIHPARETNEDTTFILSPARKVDSITVSNSREKSHFNNVAANVNLRQTFSRPGQELTADADYLHYYSGNDQLFDNFFFDPKLNTMHPATNLFVHLPAKIDVYSGKIDYVHPFAHRLRMEVGGKASWVKADNTADYFDGVDVDAPVNSGLTNHFIYKEQIQAGYANLNKEFSRKWTAQAGLRVEHTHTEGIQLVNNQDFKRNYTQAFPTAFIQYKLNKSNQFVLDYGRRIDRPSYQDMNPFLYFLDVYTYTAGNPDLRPQLSNTIELKHTYKDFLVSTVSYSRTTDIINNVINQVDSTKVAYLLPANVAKATYYSANISFNRSVTRWWKVSAYVQESYNHLKGTLNNAGLDLDKYTFYANINNQFEVRKGLVLELGGFYSTGGLDGTRISRPMGTLNFGASQQVLDKKGTVRLSVTDFANILNYDGVVRFQNSDQMTRYKPDTRVVSLSFTYRFNKGKIVKRQVRSGIEEEQGRIKSGN
ncbi:MAG: TonB-dependent receptor [Bacteroidetes bacterium]|nr:TonB-dependent receptor [Bacteroidota bacterium]